MSETTPAPQRTHDLKIWTEPFQAILDGRKRFEIRKNDRGYSTGDTLHLQEWTPPRVEDGAMVDGKYTGREMTARVTYLVPGGAWGLPADLCVMGIEPAPQRTEETMPDDLEKAARLVERWHTSKGGFTELAYQIRALRSPAPAESAAPWQPGMVHDQWNVEGADAGCTNVSTPAGPRCNNPAHWRPASPPPVAREAETRIGKDICPGCKHRDSDGSCAWFFLPDVSAVACASFEPVSLARESAKENK